MNIIIISTAILILLSITIVLSIKARKEHSAKVLAKHGLLQHKARQEQRAKEMAKNQALFK